jgi:phosphoribosylformimino-5-aminoimidazole carboxamide ribotide isomerase
MILYPAIDLKDGQAVRLKQGRFDDVTVYFEDPLEAAQKWIAAGAQWLHVVDLNGAMEGKPVNTAAIERIMQGVDVPVQIGGGIRSQEIAEIYLTLGAGRIVLGTKAMEEPELITTLNKAFPGLVAVGIDAKDGKVAVRGWKETGTEEAIDLARRLEDSGAACIIYTDISRDGMLTGPNFEATQIMAQTVKIPVIASGGISGIEDIKRLKGMESEGVAGAILGRSIYEGTLDLKEALEIAGE